MPKTCCHPFPKDPKNLAFCWAADSTYCRECGRWLEKELEYIKRPKLHPVDCKKCRKLA